ncbi:MAG: alpha/beta fold hydrolase [Xanthobacteraceae bacterium]
MAARELRHQVGDIAVRLFRDGAGEPVLFLHGAAGVPPWNVFFEKLAGRYDVLVPEHPGFSTAENAATIRSVADAAMYYLDFLDGLATGPVHLVGHSLGGWIAAELAVRNCTQLLSLTLIAPAGIRVKGVPSGDNFLWGPEETARNLFYDQALAERRIAQVVTEEEADRALVNRFMAARLGWEPRWFSLSLERWLHRIKVPAFVLWGENDKLLPSAYAKRWGERVPGARVEIIDACGHLPHVEKPEISAEKILKFLAGASL